MTVPDTSAGNDSPAPAPAFPWPDVLLGLLILLLIAGLVYSATRGTGAVGVGPF